MERKEEKPEWRWIEEKRAKEIEILIAESSKTALTF